MFGIKKGFFVIFLVLIFVAGCGVQEVRQPPQGGPPEGPPVEGTRPPDFGEPTPPPTAPVSVYRGFWMPTAFMEDQSVSGVATLKDVGANIVTFGPNVKINTNGDTQLDFPMDYVESRLAELSKRYYPEGIRIGLVIETLYVKDFSEGTPPGGPPAFPKDIASKPGFLDKYNLVVGDMAKLAEKYHVEFFSPMNEPDMKLGVGVASGWGQEVLPIVKKHYNGKVLWKAAPFGQNVADINFKGYDIIGLDISPGGGPQNLATYPQEVSKMLSDALSSAERDDVPAVMFTEFGVWGGALSLSEDDKAVAHKIVFEQGKGKAKGFFVLDPPSDLDRPLKGSKSYDEVKLWFTEKL